MVDRQATDIVQKSIMGQLSAALNARDVSEIFTAASEWRNYP